MKRPLVTILLVMLILGSFQDVAWHNPVQAQNSGTYEVGDPVLVVATRLPVHVQPSLSSGVAAELLYGMNSHVIGMETDADGRRWYYLTNYTYGWVPATVGDLPSLMPFSEQALDKLLVEATAAIEANPEDVEAYVNRGTVYLVRKEFEPSIEDYSRAVQLRPDDAALHDYLGKAYLDSRDFFFAQGEFSTAIDLGRALPNTYNRLAIAIDNLSQEDLALQYYQQAIDLEPGYGILYCNRGRLIYRYRGDKSSAFDLYSRAIEVDPYLATAYVYRGDLFSDSSDTSTYPQAFEDYNRAIEIDPGDALAYAHRGVAYMWYGDWAQAEMDLVQAAELDSFYEFPVWNLASLYGLLRRYQDAVEQYTLVAELGQGNAKYALLYRAQDYLILGQYDLAMNDIEIFIAYAERRNTRTDFMITAYMVRAAVRLRLAHSDAAQYLQAAQDYTSAFGIDPNQASGFYTWGEAYGVMFYDEDVIGGLKAQLDAGSKDPDVWLQLATEYLQRGRFREALDAYERYMQLAETIPPELEQLVTTLTDLTG